MATAENKLSLKLLIDTKAKKVVFAEVEKDFVDFLFHILSLPLGSVTKLLKEKGMNGCLSNLYQSVENLNDNYLKSKHVILTPQRPLVISKIPMQLFGNVDNPMSRAIYRCSNNSCSYAATYATDDTSAICPGCWKPMAKAMTYVAPLVSAAVKGGFVKEAQVKYKVMDDLVVQPMSAVSSITGLKYCFNVKDLGALKEEVVHLGKEEALKLLKLSLESKTVLTDLFVSFPVVDDYAL